MSEDRSAEALTAPTCQECGCTTGGSGYCFEHKPYLVTPKKDGSFYVDRCGRRRVWFDQPPLPAEELAHMKTEKEGAEARVLALLAERDRLKERHDNLIADVKVGMGQRYITVVEQASGDISVNTAFKVALREERKDATDRVQQLEQERDDWHAHYDAAQANWAIVLTERDDALKRAEKAEALLAARDEDRAIIKLFCEAMEQEDPAEAIWLLKHEHETLNAACAAIQAGEDWEANVYPSWNDRVLFAGLKARAEQAEALLAACRALPRYCAFAREHQFHEQQFSTVVEEVHPEGHYVKQADLQRVLDGDPPA